MNTLQSILYINPTLKNEIDFIIEDHGKGLVLTWLNTTITQPTQAELEAAWVEVQALQQAELDKQDKSEAIQKIATLSDQLNLLAECVDRLTEGTTDPVILEAKDKFTQIKTILGV